jgi:uncharacterized membrane protein
MRTYYNRIAGQNLERLAALSDGIFAVAMTLLVLDLHVPLNIGKVAISNDRDLWLALGALSPRLLTYFMSFLTLGIFWIGQQTQINHFARSDRHLTWIHLGFLLAVSVIPFSTGLLAEYTSFRAALLVYWFNIFLLGVMLFSSIRYAKRSGLVKDDTSIEMRSAHERRIITAQILYALGALLCIINTYWSITLIVLVQLNFVIAPRLPLSERLAQWILQAVMSVRIGSSRALSLAGGGERASGDERRKRLTNTSDSHASDEEALEDQE